MGFERGGAGSGDGPGLEVSDALMGVREMDENSRGREGDGRIVRLVDELDECIDDLRGSAELLASAGVAWGEQRACGVLAGTIGSAAERLEKVMGILEERGCAPLE